MANALGVHASVPRTAKTAVCDAEVPVGDMERCDGIDNDCDPP